MTLALVRRDIDRERPFGPAVLIWRLEGRGRTLIITAFFLQGPRRSRFVACLFVKVRECVPESITEIGASPRGERGALGYDCPDSAML